MGGSLARALKGLPEPPRITALAEDEDDLHGGLEAGVLDDAVKTLGDLLPELDLLVFATPLIPTLELLGALPGDLEDHTLVTDLVSLKLPLAERARELGLSPRFVGSHPMAGGEGTGFSASRDGLFRGVRVWLCTDGASERSATRIHGLWEGLGARPAVLDAARHDAMMAWVSHLPQLLSNSLAMALEDAGLSPQALGTGGRDMTRLAGSSPEMWEDLFRAAPPELLSGLEAVEKELAEIRGLLERREIEEISVRMRRTRRWLEEERPWS
jgi:prephenate dehydrogenase